MTTNTMPGFATEVKLFEQDRVDSLDDFASEVRLLEKNYLDFLKGLGELSSVGVMHLHQRNQKREGSPCISLYVPFWYAQAFGIGDGSIIRQVALAHNYAYYAVILRDDACDLENVPFQRYMALSDLVWAKGLESFTSLSINHKYFWERLQIYLKETVQAEAFLEGRYKRINPYSDLDFAMMGKKGALMKLSAAVYADLSENRGLLHRLEPAIDFAATSLQIIDDLIDWEEDLRSGSFTYPFSCVAQSFPEVNPRDFFRYDSKSVPLIREKLFSDDVAKTVVEKSANYLRQARQQILTVTDAPDILSFIDYTLWQYDQIIKGMGIIPEGLDRIEHIEKNIKIRAQQT